MGRGISNRSQDNSVSGSLESIPLASTPMPRGPMLNATTNAATPGEGGRPSIEPSSLKESKAFDISPGSREGAFLVNDDGSSLLLFDYEATPYKKSKAGDDSPLCSESGFAEASSIVHGAQSSSKTFLEGSFPSDNQNQDQNQWRNPGHKASNWVPPEDSFNFQICDPEEHSSNSDASRLIENAKRRGEAQPGRQDKRRRTFGESPVERDHATPKTSENLESGQSLGDESITKLMQAVIEHKEECFAGLQLWQFIIYVDNVSKSGPRRPPRATACQDHLLIPLMWKQHWVLGYFQRKLSLLRLYNSLGPSTLELRKNAQKFFEWYCGKRVDQVIEIPVAQQKNNVDGGVHLIATVLCLMSSVDPGRYMDSVDTSTLRIKYANELLSSRKLSLIPASFKNLMAICHSRDMEHQEVVRRHIIADDDYKSSKVMLESLRKKMKHLTNLIKLEKMIVDA